MELPVGPAAIARAAGVPMVPVFIFREGRHRSKVFIRAPISVPSTDDRTADFAGSLQRIADEVEWAIRHEPHQWFCFRELWPDI
jgi:lauroyl/myristoyl acyltransferase